MNKKIVFTISSIVIFILGFLSGMEFKSYQLRQALSDAFNTSVSDSPTTFQEKTKEEIKTIIDRTIGEEITLATLKLKVTSVEEKQTLPVTYGTPKVAKEGAKFILVKMDLTNTTNSAFSFSPDLLIIDSQNREFSSYTGSIGGVENYLDYRNLAPSIKESGYLIFEIPTNALDYSLLVAKAGSNELYKISLK